MSSVKKGARTTMRGFGTSQQMEVVSEPETLEPLVSDGQPPFEIAFYREKGTPSLLDARWAAIEMWTSGRIYSLDQSLYCIAVTDRASAQTVPDHPILGAQLMGGQRRAPGGAIVQVSHPLPRRGMTAVFAEEIGGRSSISETSSVTRVVLRQRVVDLGPEAAPPAWDTLSGITSS